MSIRLLLVDDHALIREGLRAVLEVGGEMKVVGEAASGLEAIEAFRGLHPDVALLDVGMPGMDGLASCKRIRDEHPDARIVILTVHAEEQFFFEALRAGAHGYVLKRSPGEELRRAIRAVAEGRTWLSPELAGSLVEDFVGRVRAGQDDLALGTLSAREREVLKLVAEGHTSAEIAKLLSISAKTVQTHRAHAMEKLGLHERTGLVRYAIRTGLIEP
ncbi:MAG TPA: response regulator transcription factor [Solirubrobacterales bacterium]|nr:response regulator transcription factor [Solirubrobacterales bacterium]